MASNDTIPTNQPGLAASNQGTIADLLLAHGAELDQQLPSSSSEAVCDGSQAALTALRHNVTIGTSQAKPSSEQVVLEMQGWLDGALFGEQDATVHSNGLVVPKSSNMLANLERQWTHRSRPSIYLRPGKVTLKDWSRLALLPELAADQQLPLDQLAISKLRSTCSDAEMGELLQEIAEQPQDVVCWYRSGRHGWHIPIRLVHRKLDSVSALICQLWSKREEAEWLYLAMLRPIPSMHRLAPIFPEMFRLRLIHHLMARIVPDLTDSHFNWDQLENKQAELLGDSIAAWLSCCSIKKPEHIRAHILALLAELEHSVWLRQACLGARQGQAIKALPALLKVGGQDVLNAAEMGVVIGSLFAGIQKYVDRKKKQGVQRFYWLNKVVQFVFAGVQILPEIIDSSRIVSGSSAGAVAFSTVLLTTVLEQAYPICDWDQVTKSMRGELRLKMQKSVIASQRYESHTLFRWVDTVLECNGVT